MIEIKLPSLDAYTETAIHDFCMRVYEKALEDYKYYLEHGTNVIAYNKDGTIRDRFESPKQLKKWLTTSDIANYLLEEPEIFIEQFERRVKDGI